jgi:hypothetical protein
MVAVAELMASKGYSGEQVHSCLWAEEGCMGSRKELVHPKSGLVVQVGETRHYPTEDELMREEGPFHREKETG